MRTRNLFFTSLFAGLLGWCSVQMVFAQPQNCDDFIGEWKFEGDDFNMSAQRTVVAQFFPDHRFHVVMSHEGLTSGRDVYLGRWQCRDGLQTMHYESVNGYARYYSQAYEILELTPVNFRIRSTPEICGDTGSDCPTVYEYIRQ